MRPPVSTFNVETILEENVQSEISLSHVIDVDTSVPENEISSGSETSSHGIPHDTAPTGCPLPGLTSASNSSKKRK